jgi:hypothetical protein
MDLNPEQLERLRRLDNRGKPVCPRFKDDRNVTLFLGHIEDEIEVFTDGENKFVIQKIRCAPEHQHHGDYLYRITYYTVGLDDRLHIGGQMAPIMNVAEIRSLLEQALLPVF